MKKLSTSIFVLTLAFGLLFGSAKAQIHCDLLKNAIVGTNVLEGNMPEESFQLIPSLDGYYRISVPLNESLPEIYLRVYSGKENCLESYFEEEGEFSFNYWEGPELRVYLKLDAGKAYYFHFRSFTEGVANNWELLQISRSEAEGVLCETAIQVSESASVTANPSKHSKMWYRFIPGTSGFYNVSSCGSLLASANSFLTILSERDPGSSSDIISNHCGLSVITSSDNLCRDNGVQKVFSAEAGKAYYILWDAASLGSTEGSKDPFSWQISPQADATGMLCETATPVNTGNNTVDHTTLSSVWQSFQPAAEGVYAIESCGVYAYFDLFEGPCDNSIYLGSYDTECHESKIPNTFYAKPGSTYYIRWNNTDQLQYTYQLKIVNDPDNSFCAYASAVQHQSGIRINNKYKDEAWFSFTPTETDYYSLQSCEGELSAEVYIGTCSANEAILYAYNPCPDSEGNRRAPFLGEQGKTYLIKWMSRACPGSGECNHTWDLIKENAETNSKCETAKNIQPGESISSAFAYSHELWFKFQADEEAYYELDATAYSDFLGVSVSRGMCEYEDYQTTIRTEENKHYFYVPAGDVYICLNGNTDNPDSFNWMLKKSTNVPQGIDCRQAIDVSLNTTVQKEEHTDWFRFAPEASGAYEIASDFAFNSFVEYDITVLTGDDCERLSPVAGIDDGGGEEGFKSIPFYATAGKVYYINWENVSHSSGAFTWKIQASSVNDNRLCHYAAPAVLGNNDVNQDGADLRWYTFSASQTGVYKASSCRDAVNLTVLTGNCDQLSIVADAENYIGDGNELCNKGIVFYAESGDNFFFAWNIYEESGAEPYSWTLEKVNDIPEDNRFCAFAESIALGQEISSTDTEFRWYTFTPQETDNYRLRVSGTDNLPNYRYFYASLMSGSCKSLSEINNEIYCIIPEEGYEETRHFALEAGKTYYFRIDPEQSCQWSVVKASTSGLESSVQTMQVSVYPNPASDHVWVEISGKAAAVVTLASIQGSRIPVGIEEMDGRLRIDLSALPEGIYILNVDGTMHKIVKK